MAKFTVASDVVMAPPSHATVLPIYRMLTYSYRDFPKVFLLIFNVKTIDLRIPSPQRSISSLQLRHMHGVFVILAKFQ